jgi:hypothetical protein
VQRHVAPAVVEGNGLYASPEGCRVQSEAGGRGKSRKTHSGMAGRGRPMIISLLTKPIIIDTYYETKWKLWKRLMNY